MFVNKIFAIRPLTIVASTLRLFTSKNESNLTESYILVNHLSRPFLCPNFSLPNDDSKRSGFIDRRQVRPSD